MIESSSLDSLIARKSTGLSARKILRSSICFIRLFTFKDAILKPARDLRVANPADEEV